ncbi:MAG TPA: hypothetical protein GXZ70_03910 [Clostridiales bacterium]|nr:hypothetical protein [Clostridiales bacterium]
MRGRNTENEDVEHYKKNPSILHKCRIVYKFKYKTIHVTFNINEIGSKRRTINNEVKVIIAITI